ncbi:MAG: peptidylprolyl isomerase [Deltaproteobacteria bacterium]|nr:MAG: peptidylprolyl isomerase [Deltaproteobacteria bacterium]
MKIGKDAMVGIEFSMSLDSGEEVDSSEPGKPLTFVFDCGQMLPGLERQLEGMEAGQSTKFTVEPEDGFGMPREELLQKVPRSRFPEGNELKPGMAFMFTGPSGSHPFTVREIDDENVTIDFNHPLCGQRLHFDVKVVEVRQATVEELESARQEATAEA